MFNSREQQCDVAIGSSDEICQVLFLQNIASVDRNMPVTITLLSIYLKVVAHHCTNSILFLSTFQIG